MSRSQVSVNEFLQELPHFFEDYDYEAKAAQGRGGEGELPASFWSTYSAMANTDGGYVYLGVREDKKQFLVKGLANVDRVRKALWDGVNNPQIISHNLLRNIDVNVLRQDEREILIVQIPRATRQQRPIYVGPNPLKGTYRRNHEGDYLCDEATVRRMMAEATEETRDARLLEDYTLEDLDADSLSLYRSLFRVTKPNHPWLAYEEEEFLRNLGGWARDRTTRKEGLTLAGLLMFGKLRSILDVFPNYVVDYQEQSIERNEQRWLDRVTTDGTWSGNIFDFYRRVYSKLIAELKVPFRMERGEQRIDETHVHEALREALVNTLIHADYDGRVSILVVKKPNLFGFRNPGNLRLPLHVALAGGESDCRNRNLQKMFQLIGASEQAGSGMPKILRAWHEQHWQAPLLREESEREQTILRLPTISLLHPDTISVLQERFGPSFDSLSDKGRLAVATAFSEGVVSNERLRAMTEIHSRDCSHLFRQLVEQGFLEPDGIGRWTTYHIPSEPITEGNSEHSESNSEHSESNSEHSKPNSEQWEHLMQIAKPVREKNKATQKEMSDALIMLCRECFLTTQELSELLGRTTESLRIRHLSAMIKSGQIIYRFPDIPNHPQQAYGIAKSLFQPEDLNSG